MANLTITAADVAPVYIIKQMTGPANEAVDAGEVVYRLAASGKLGLADADAAAPANEPDGVAIKTAAQANDTITHIIDGIVDLGDALDNLDYGDSVYLSATAGKMADADDAGTNIIVGEVVPSWGATTADKLLWVQPQQTAGSVGVSQLSGNLQTGFIPLGITTMRVIATNDIQNTAADGGVLASDTNPNLARVNGATDKALRVTWTAENDEVETTFDPVAMPPDLDESSDVTVHLLMAMEDTNDTPTVDVQAFDGVGDTEMGGATGAVTGTSVAEYTVTLSSANISGHPTGFLNIALVPAAHSTDDLYLYKAWIEYTRKS